jgi:ribonuclease T1
MFKRAGVLILALLSLGLVASRSHHLAYKGLKVAGFKASAATVSVPPKAHAILNYVQSHHGHAPKGYEGGREFKNWDAKLAKTDPDGKPITYHEYDVNPHKSHINRGTERLVLGSDGKAYYSGDHYNTFVPVGP